MRLGDPDCRNGRDWKQPRSRVESQTLPTLGREGGPDLPGSFQRLTQMDLLWHLRVMDVPGTIH